MFLDKFCDYCGGKLTKDEEVCPHCGAKLKALERRLCKQCGAELAIGQIYCGQCGTRYDEIPSDEDFAAKLDDITVPKVEELSEDDLTRIIEMDEGFQSALAGSERESKEADEILESESDSTGGSVTKSLNILIGTLLFLFGLGGTIYTQTAIEKEWWYTYEPPYTSHEMTMLFMKFSSIALVVVGLIVIIVSLCRSGKK